MKVLRPVFAAFAMFSAFPAPKVEWNRENLRWMLCAFPLAKDTGLAHTFAQAADKRAVRRFLAGLSALLCLGLLFYGWRGAAMSAAALGVFLYYRKMAQKQFGGLSGDLAGWFLQTAEGLCWTAPI